MGSGAQYVVGAYAVILFALVMYVVLLGLKAARMARETELLARLVERQGPIEDEPGPDGEGLSPEIESAGR
jgi:hypothetical protein